MLQPNSYDMEYIIACVRLVYWFGPVVAGNRVHGPPLHSTPNPFLFLILLNIVTVISISINQPYMANLVFCSEFINMPAVVIFIKLSILAS